MEYEDGPITARGSKWAAFSQELRPRAGRLLCNRIAIGLRPYGDGTATSGEEGNRAISSLKF